MSRNPGGAPSESSSDEEYYDNFAALKRKHQVVENKRPAKLAVCTSPPPRLAAPAEDILLSDSSLEDQMDVLERAKRDAKRQKGARTIESALDDEMAELLDSPMSSDCPIVTPQVRVGPRPM